MTYILSTMIMILKTIKSWQHFQGLWGEPGKPSLPSHSQRWGVGEWRWSESRRVKWFIWKYNDEQSGCCVGTSDLEAGPVSARGRSPFFTIATKDICHRSGIGDQAHNMIKRSWTMIFQNLLSIQLPPSDIWSKIHLGKFSLRTFLLRAMIALVVKRKYLPPGVSQLHLSFHMFWLNGGGSSQEFNLGNHAYFIFEW